MTKASRSELIAAGYEVNQPVGVIGEIWYAWTPRPQLIGEYETEDEAWDMCAAHWELMQ